MRKGVCRCIEGVLLVIDGGELQGASQHRTAPYSTAEQSTVQHRTAEQGIPLLISSPFHPFSLQSHPPASIQCDGGVSGVAQGTPQHGTAPQSTTQHCTAYHQSRVHVPPFPSQVSNAMEELVEWHRAHHSTAEHRIQRNGGASGVAQGAPQHRPRVPSHQAVCGRHHRSDQPLQVRPAVAPAVGSKESMAGCQWL
ncbi:unnamed protein product [Closterium sp. NIES-54]